MGRKHRWWCVLYCFFIRIRPLLLIPVCLGMGRTGTGLSLIHIYVYKRQAIDYNELTNFAAWDNKTQEIIALQNKWKTIGFAPQKMNVKIFERFRKACDEFFRKKGEFFKALKEGMNANLDKKRALCEKAEALKDSTDWKATADELTKLQKEWKMCIRDRSIKRPMVCKTLKIACRMQTISPKMPTIPNKTKQNKTKQTKIENFPL